MDRSEAALIIVPIVLIVLGLRVWMSTRARKLRVERMWVGPAIFVFILAISIYDQPPPPGVLSWTVLAIAGALGVFIGFYRGRMVRISIDMETHALTSQQSPWGMLIFLGLIGARYGIRFGLNGAHEFDGIPVSIILDGLTAFYGGSVIGMRYEMWQRAQKLLSDAQAAKAHGEAVPAELSQDRA
ncbi:MAG: DUF1453 family protein [Alphaproteobacteria bacterium]|nr:DUF1453 family protein [Alphaproteobacteria bacterium]